jgi:hypothetical protein
MLTKRRNLLFLSLLCFVLVAGLILSAYFYSFIDENPEILIRSLGFLLMALSGSILFGILGNRWLGALGIMHFFMLILYHCFSDLLYAMFSSSNHLRPAIGVDPYEAAMASLIAGCGILAFTLGYAFIKAGTENYTSDSVYEETIHYKCLLSLNTKVLTLWYVLIVFYKVGGVNFFLSSSRLSYWLGAFLGTLFIMVIITIRLFIEWKLKRINKYILITFLLTFIVFFGLFGTQRQSVLWSLIPVVILLARWNIYRVTPKQFLTGVVSLVLVFSLLASVRSDVGREDLKNSTPLERINLTIEALGDILVKGETKNLEVALGDISSRFDGNAYLAHFNNHLPSENKIDLAYYLIPLRLTIPSSIWSGKLDTPVEERDMEGFIKTNYKVPPTDFLMTPISTFFASGGWASAMGGMFLIGMFLAFIDRNFWYCKSIWCIGIVISLAIGFVHAEHNFVGLSISLRDGIIATVMLILIGKLIGNKPALSSAERN